MDRLKPAVALLFRRAAEPEVLEDALVRQASLDLHWFSPKDARRFLDAARAQGLLKPGAAPGTVAPAFAVGAVEVPLDFRIDASALEGLETRASPVAEDLVARAASLRGVPAETVWREVEHRQARALVERPVAAALVAAEAGVDLRPFLPRIREELAALARARPASPSSS